MSKTNRVAVYRGEDNIGLSLPRWMSVSEAEHLMTSPEIFPTVVEDDEGNEFYRANMGDNGKEIHYSASTMRRLLDSPEPDKAAAGLGVYRSSDKTEWPETDPAQWGIISYGSEINPIDYVVEQRGNVPRFAERIARDAEYVAFDGVGNHKDAISKLMADAKIRASERPTIQ